MNSNTRKQLRWSILTAVVVLSLSSVFAGTLGPIDQEVMTEGDPMRSGGSYAGSGAASQGALLGPASDTNTPSENGFVARVLGTTFEGFGFDDNATENGGFVFIPPDPMGAAGIDRLVGVVNTMIEARTKAGALLWRDALEDFFSPLGAAALGTFTFDPKVIFDHHENRFVVVTLERTDTINGDPSNESRILLAVSKDDTPASAAATDWNYLAINSKIPIAAVDHWADYPGFEVDEEAVYITNNLFSFGASPTFGGVRLWIVAKGTAGGFYAGSAATVTVHDPYASSGIATTTMPCEVFGAGGVGPGIGNFLVSYSGLSGGGNESIQVVRIDDPLGTPAFARELVGVGDIDNTVPALPDAPQSGTATLIEVNDRRALDCVWRDDRAWLTTTVLPDSGPDAGQATAHWVKLDTSAVPGAITLTDQGNIGGEDIAVGTTTYFPSVALGANGTAKFGFAASAASIFAGAFVTGRVAADPAGSVQASDTIKAGEDFYIRTFGGPRNRWGDYSGISLDPTDGSFWVFNEFADTRGTVISGEDGRWGTAWGNSAFPQPFAADLALTKADFPDPVTAGDNLTYTITVTNNGPDAATGVVVTDTLPSGVTFVSATPSQGNCSGTATVTCNLGGLNNGANATVTIVVRPAPAAVPSLSNTASVSGTETDPNNANDSDAEGTTVNPLLCKGLAATIVGTAGSDTLNGTSVRDIIAGLGGNDTINGWGGNDLVCAGSGNDTVSGGDGKDRLLGEGGKDRLKGGSNRDRLEGGSGRDRIEGGSGNDRLNGGSGPDTLIGGPQNDKLTGDSGNDGLLGGSGFDTCSGGAGTDTAVACERVNFIP